MGPEPLERIRKGMEINGLLFFNLKETVLQAKTLPNKILGRELKYNHYAKKWLPVFHNNNHLLLFINTSDADYTL
ncbi:MAG: hypothetical protein LBQ12_05075 [Deltaproteobacteria bacterium]|nr:hypothetical protein [Deltaproteobacteria bacterium]